MQAAPGFSPGTCDVRFFFFFFLRTYVCVYTCTSVCVSLHVTNDNAMYSIRRGHFIQNVTLLPSAHCEAPVVQMPQEKNGFMI